MDGRFINVSRETMIAATLCYLKREGYTLMIHRNKKKNDIHKSKWNGLGGKIEKGETPEECVIREVYEESGILIKNPVLKGVITFPEFKGEDWLVFVFVAYTNKKELIESKEGSLSWIKEEEITRLNLWEGDRIFLKWLKKDRFFSAKFVYIKESLSHHSVVFY